MWLCPCTSMCVTFPDGVPFVDIFQLIDMWLNNHLHCAYNVNLVSD